MNLRLDHVVIGVASLERASADYESLGFNVLQGGHHPGRPTHNALVVFADGSYLELIAFREPAPDHPWWARLQALGEGLLDFALLPADTASTIAAAAGRGLHYRGPEPGGRERPDGQRLAWQIGRPPSPDLPFLCGDLTPHALRVPEGEARRHPNGATGIAALSLAVQDVAASLQRYRALLGEAAVPAGLRPEGLPGLALRQATLTLAGGTRLLLLDPRGGDTAVARELRARLTGPGQGPWALSLAAGAGQGPWALSLAAGAGQPHERLDPGRSHGAWIELAPAVPIPQPLQGVPA